jgi:hypothetical protein
MKDTVSYNDAIYMLDSGAYELIYNSCYGGGPYLLEKGKELFKALRGNQLDTSGSLLQLKVVPGKYSQFAFALVRKGLRKYMDLNEYDGLEHPSICLSQMIMEEVKRVLEAKGMLMKEE